MLSVGKNHINDNIALQYYTYIWSLIGILLDISDGKTVYHTYIILCKLKV